MTQSSDKAAAIPAASRHDLSVVETVLNLVTDDSVLSEREKLLVLASLEGDDAIATELDGGEHSESPFGLTPAETVRTEVEAVGAFLKAITVSGFRGIGDKAQLNLHPGPGLTVVAGRNGSGKSSFAEALEYALTGESYRWKGRAPSWKDSWRNLHQIQSAQVRVELAEEGVGRTEIGVEWAADAELGDSKSWTQRHGKPRTPGVDALGWGRALELYRPILSYEELGQRLDGTPTDLYRSLESILGLDQIADGVSRLGQVVKRLKGPADEAATAKKALKLLLESATDNRAQAVLSQLRKHQPDVDLVGGIATGVATPDEVGSQLRTLSQLAIPEKEATESIAQELVAAVQKLADAGGAAHTQTESRSRLLEMALDFHAEHGEQNCPVCDSAVLDDGWRERVTTELAAERAELAAVRAVRHELGVRRDAARAQIGVPNLPTLGSGLELTNLAEAEAVLKNWREAPTSDVELARHLTSNITTLVSALTLLRDEAAARLSERDDSWRRLAQQTAVWVELKRAADAVDTDLHDAKAAWTWLKDNAEGLRNQRLEPLADEARRIWASLRQESSIDLDKITLSGQRTRGRVKLTAKVDGVPTDALPVMSQGELNAIALALFLPRATMAASPLRFVVLDDPVQAMDPAKVDGLTEVLLEYAKDRQVIVFSHDDRLAESVRRTAPTARIVQVERGTGSKVEVVECQSPARRYVEDAQELLRDENLPTEVLRKAIPAYARFAVEAAAHEVYFRRELTAGKARGDVEKAWMGASTTSLRVALAVHGARAADLSNWKSRRYRQRVLKLCGPDAHNSLSASPEAALDDLRKTVDDLLDERR
ncbi:AAA family ATPase [Kribbella sp. VKM Ac-2568]|uniref:AAA family ATPase n=1 Tax=Kribbella sp. VKM Ac-2568 TaxID=2512219 RepID=UPI001043C739|nr:AAA family ATPase [Kribbella sp. VKM Ac-2568]TCM51299.1 RecF/RecN/SMC family protein [Kribbella sp. VKM Ac-2568]